jgi:hypothetical protein
MYPSMLADGVEPTSEANNGEVLREEDVDFELWVNAVVVRSVVDFPLRLPLYSSNTYPLAVK